MSNPATLSAAGEGQSLSGTNRWLKNRLMERLGGLKQGTLTIKDADGPTVLGHDDGASANLNAEIVVRSPDFYREVALGGSLSAARCFAEGQWDSPDLTRVFQLLARNSELIDGVDKGVARFSALLAWVGHRRNANNRAGSKRNIIAHYDLGNEFFALFLDPTMTYSSGVFPHAGSTLEEASIEKLDRICRKLELEPHHRVLEVGCGWGSFAIHAARNYGCHVTSTTISDEQYALARQRVAEAGLEDRISIVKQDYRDLDGQFDRLASIEMIEAVGHEFLPAYFKTCADRLKPDGRAVIQAISMPDQRYEQYLKASDFIQTMVFPGSCCPSLGAMVRACSDASDLSLVGAEDIAPHYARTLAMWRDRFDSQIENVRLLGFDDQFIRMWRYYLCYCEAGFEERYLRTFQLEFNKPAYRSRMQLEERHGH